jgi:spore germination cell wall hydrolase CwlJ-like protein
MNTFKKLFLTLAAVLVISLCFSPKVYATELSLTEKAENTEIANDKVNQEYTEADVKSENTDESNTSGEDTASDILDLEGEFDPDAYEIYIDEQGQVFYFEKEPAEPEILDSDEIIAEEADKEEKAKSPTYTEEDLRLLACLVYAEAGNQSYKGMLAVANVVLNRVKSDAYYHVNTIKEVIYDKQWAVQFSVTIKSKKTGKSMLDKALEAYDTGKFTGKNPEAEKKAMNRAIKAAKAALNGENNIGNYLCFRMNNSGAKSIKKKYSDYKIIGDHIFYRTK